jgi:hypothetical protein
MHTEWENFLTSSGAVLKDGYVRDFGQPDAEAKAVLKQDIIADLSCFSLVKISGQDAGNFLHGQFSSEINRLAEYTGQFSTWCTPQGRMLANFLLIRTIDDYFLMLHSDLRDRFIQRLKMYILRASVSVQDMGNTMSIIGMRGAHITSLLQASTGAVPQSVLTGVQQENLLLFQLPDESNRILVTGDYAALTSLWKSTGDAVIPVGIGGWILSDILNGIAWVDGNTTEKYMPVEFNMDQLGGISYRKGCFPGQEILARLQYRGKVKQRLQLAFIDREFIVHEGDKLYTLDGAEAAGVVIRAAGHPGRGTAVMALVNAELAHTGKIQAGEGTHAILDFAPLPYATGTA